ncbi:Crp/Fnr family transcriptional regulator [Clostridium sp. PL3]|uniref:Crp/Fnr family transcriptional regulator n=1 Tax=Clostridium thailandense TaxID=2794346 RepID=A0A949WTS1_9CLOT|nr:Crp/Fnr family transcriptional regulator [Clostridium thailandense]MBV7276650.1 Crp/Fnr family transcriptional regulator [Clostridium thailandense]
MLIDNNNSENSIYMKNAFSREEMDFLFEGAREIRTKKNTLIYEQGDILKHVYWLADGLAEVYLSNNEGMKQVMCYHYAPSIIADVSAFEEKKTILTCNAVKSCLLYKCSIDTFYDRIQSMGLMRRYLKLLVEKTQTAAIQLGSIAMEDCEERVSRYYNNQLTHQQLADLIGCTRVQVTRIINKKYKKKA